jgi:hypothetical protein
MDKYAGFANLSSQAERWEVIVPNDAADLPSGPPKALRFNAAGNVALTGNDGVTVVFAVAAGEVLNLRPRAVKATNTTVAAGNIIGLYD